MEDKEVLDPINSLPENTRGVDPFEHLSVLKAPLVNTQIPLAKSSEMDFDKYKAVLGDKFQLSRGEEVLQREYTKAVADQELDSAQKKADEQGFFFGGESGWNPFKGELAQGTGSTIGNFLYAIPKYAGYLLDLEATYDFIAGNEADWGNWLSDAWTDENPDDDVFKVWQSVAGQGNFLQNSTQWLMGEALPQLGDMAGMQVATMGIGGIAGQGVKNLTKLAGITTTPTKARIAQGITNAIFSRDMESKAEAAQVYKQEYEKLLNRVDPSTGKNFTEEDAKKLANEAGTFVYRNNWINILQDIPEQLMMLRGFKAAKSIDDINVAKAAGTSTKAARLTKYGNRAKIAGTEAIEEGGQFVISEEAIHSADVKAGIKKDNNFSDRLAGYLQDGELWESMALGALGGGVMQSLSPKVQDYVNKRMSPEYKTERETRINEIRDRWASTSPILERMQKAKDSNDPKAYEVAKNELKTSIAVRAANAGNLDLVVSQIENLASATPQEITNFGLDEDFKKDIPKLVEDIKWIGNQYAKNVSRYEPNTVEPILQRQVAIKQFNEQLPKINQEITKLTNEIPRINELSLVGHDILQKNAQVRALENTKKSFETKLNDPKTDESQKPVLQEIVTELSKRIDESANIVRELSKTSDYTAEDKAILKSIPDPIKEDLYKNIQEKIHTEKAIQQYGEEINLLTSKKGQKSAKEANIKFREEAASKTQAENQARVKQKSEEEVAKVNVTNTEELSKAPDITKEVKTPEIEDSEEANDTPVSNATLKNSLENIKDEVINTKGESATVANTVGEFEEPIERQEKRVLTKEPLGAAWVSARNIRATDTENTDLNKARTLFFENPTIDMSAYEVRLEVDYDYLNATPELKELADLIKSGKELTLNQLDELPIRATFYKDNEPFEYSGQPIYTYLKSSNYKGFDPSIKELAQEQLNTLRSQVLQAGKEGKIVSTKVMDRTHGYIPVFEDEELKFINQNNVAEFLKKDSSDIKLAISQSSRYKDKDGDIEELSNYDTKSSGAIYAIVTGANGKVIPMRLFTQTLSEDEVNLVFNLFKDMVNNKQYGDVLSDDIKKLINSSENPVIKDIPKILGNLNDVKYIELLSFMVFLTEPGSTSRNTLLFNKGKVAILNTPYTREDFVNKEFDIKNALGNFTRQINKQYLNNPDYNQYLIDNKLVYTNAIPSTLEGFASPLVQPLITFDSDIQIADNIKRNSEKEIEDARLEELYKYDISLPEGELIFKGIETESGFENTKEYKDKVKQINDKYNLELERLSKTSINNTIEEQATDLDSKEDLKKDIVKPKRELTEEEIKIRKKFDSDDFKFKMSEPVIVPSDIINLEEELAWYQENLPQVPISVIKDLIQVNTQGAQAYGMFHNAMVTISEQAKRGTVYHEAFHAVFNLMLTHAEREQILNEASKRYGIPRSNTNSNQPLYSLKSGEEFSVEYLLKAQDLLSSPKADQIFEKGKKNKWTLEKMLNELGVPKDQQKLIDEVQKDMSHVDDIPFNFQLALELAKYTYTVEIKTSKNDFATEDNMYEWQTAESQAEVISLESEGWVQHGHTEDGIPWYKKPRTPEKMEDHTRPTQYYSNLTVPGGINYTENEISTPDITPSIKGHAQFSTNEGIGWFRSDTKAINQDLVYRLSGKELDDRIKHLEESLQNSDSASFSDIVELRELKDGRTKLGEATKTRRILEVQSDLFQKGRNNKDLVGNKEGYKEGGLEMIDLKEKPSNEKQNQFLQLLNKDNNWVTFFVKSIIQDSAKKGYEKVLFPKGDTASKVEGHETLANEIAMLDIQLAYVSKYSVRDSEVSGYEVYDTAFNERKSQPGLTKKEAESFISDKRELLEKRKSELKTQGIEKLKPIYAFYEVRVKNILDKQYGKENIKTITDEYGNEWYELTIDEKVKSQKILLSKVGNDKYKGLTNDTKLEEKIAEDFELFKETGISDFGKDSSTLKWYQKLWNMIRNLFSNKLTVNKLQNRINSGYYANKSTITPVENSPLYSRKVADFTPAELKSTVDTLLFVMFKSRKNIDIRDFSDLNPNNAKLWLEYQIEKLTTNNDLEAIKRYQKVLNALTTPDNSNLNTKGDLYKAIQDKLNTYGIIDKNKTAEAKEEDLEEETEGYQNEVGDLNIKASYETSLEEGATAATKLLIATTPSIKNFDQGSFRFDENGNIKIQHALEYNLDPYLGVPYMEDYSNLLKKVQNICADIVPVMIDNQLEDGFNLMIDKMYEESKYFPSLGLLAVNLLQQDEQIQTQFYFTMSSTKINFQSTFVTENKDGGYNVKVGNPDVQSVEEQLREEWFEILKDVNTTFSDEKSVLSKEYVEEVNHKYHLIYNGLPKTGNLELQDYNDVIDLLELVGIQMTYQGLRRAVDNATGETPANKLRNIFTSDEYGLNYIFTKQLPAIADKDLDEVPNIFKDNKGVLYIAENQGWLNASYSQDSILMAEGNQYYTYSKHNLVTRQLSEWKQNPQLVKVLRDKYVYNQNSVWLNEMIKPDGTVDIKKVNNFKALFYGHFKEEDSDGVKQADLTEPDELMDRINRLLSGTWVNLAKADKSTDIQFKGPKLLSTGTYIDKDGNYKFRNESAVIDVFLGYIADELNRVRLVKQQIGTLSKKEQIQYYHTNGNGLNIYLFNSLSYNKEGREYGLYDTEGMPLVVEHNSLKNNTKLVDHIKSTLNELLKKEKQNWISNKIIENKLIGTNIVSKYKKLNSDDESIYNAALGDYVVNGIIGNVEMTKIFTGDPALYKEKSGNLFEDFAKRVPAIIASGSDSRILSDIPSKYKSAVVSNIDKIKSSTYTNPEFIEIYAELLKQRDIDFKKETKTKDEYTAEATKTLEAYQKVNQTDAQAYITFQGYKNRLRMWGKWGKYHQEFENELNTWIESGYRDKISYQKALRLSLQYNIGMQPLKTVHVEQMPHLGTMTLQYNKQSEGLLNPLFTIGTDLDKLRIKMESEGVEHVVVNDGKKVGAIGITEIANPETGKLHDEFTLNPVSLSYTRLSLQQDLPNKGMKDTLLGSQVKKNILTNIVKDGIYNLEGKDITGIELVQELFNTESALSDIGLKEVLTDLGYTEDNPTINKEKLRQLLLTNITKRPVCFNAIEAVELGLPIEAMSNFKKKMQTVLLSEINKKTVKIKAFGGSFVQMSNFGFADLDERTKSGVIWLKGKQDLKPPTIVRGEDGKLKQLPGQVLIPYSAIKNIEGYHEMAYKNLISRIDPKLLEGLTYRIPNQNMSSNDYIEIVGILPPSVGDTMIAYTEITTKTGSDFDIDKQYLTFPEFTVNKETNRLEYVPSNEKSKKGLANKRLEIYKAILMDSKTLTAKIKPLDETWLKDDINSLFKPELTGDLSWFTPSTQMTIKRQFQGGKFGVGQTANMVTDHPLGQIAELFLNGINLGKGNVNLQGYTDFSQVYDEGSTEADGFRKRLISDNIATFLNAYVDIAKDPFIERGNHNTMTANVTFMLLRAGVSRTWVNRFIGQPILKELVKEQGISDSNMNDDRTKPVDRLRKKYSFTEAKVTDLSELSEKTLEDNILNNKSEQNEYILNLFVSLQNLSKEFRDQLAVSKADTQGATKTLIGARVIMNKKNKVSESGVIGNFDNKFENTMLGTYFENSVETVLEIFKDTFFSETKVFLNTTNEVLNNLGKGALYDEELGNLINDELYTYVMSNINSPYSFTKEELKEFTQGKNNIASRLNSLKYGKNKSISTRPLINYLTTKKGRKGDPDFVGVTKSKQVAISTQDEIYQDWENMLNDNNPVLKKFAEDLIKYSYMNSGFRNNLFSFFEYIPSKWLADNKLDEFINGKIQEFNETDIVLDDFISQFMRNNWNDNKIVPIISLKKADILNSSVMKSNGFTLDDPTYQIGFNEDGLPEYKRFLKTKAYTNEFGQYTPAKLYKLQGYNNILKNNQETRVAVYTIAQPLGFNQTGRVIKEYYFGNEKPSSGINKNQPVVDKAQVDNIMSYIGKITDKPKSVSFEFVKDLVQDTKTIEESGEPDVEVCQLD